MVLVYNQVCVNLDYGSWRLASLFFLKLGLTMFLTTLLVRLGRALYIGDCFTPQYLGRKTIRSDNRPREGDG